MSYIALYFLVHSNFYENIILDSDVYQLLYVLVKKVLWFTLYFDHLFFKFQ